MSVADAPDSLDPIVLKRGDYSISTDPARLDLAVIHGFLNRSPWAAGIPIETLRRGIAASLCFGVYHKEAQVGFARVISDYATFAYLADVFMLEDYRGRKLARMLMTTIKQHPRLQSLRRFVLVTQRAHGLYKKFGFQPVTRPDTYMEIFHPDLYRTLPSE